MSQSSSAGQSSSPAIAARATVSFGVAHTLRGLRGDEDDDEFESKTEGSVPGGDADNDRDNDSMDNAGKVYYDKDDTLVRAYGSAPDTAEKRRLTDFVKRYYEAGVAKDGATACSLLDSAIARTVAGDYGQGGGPSYLRGAKSCPEVVIRLFGHLRGELTGAIFVTAVRVSGDRAYVLLGSATAPASFMILKREAGTWKLEGLLATPLP